MMYHNYMYTYDVMAPQDDVIVPKYDVIAIKIKSIYTEYTSINKIEAFLQRTEFPFNVMIHSV